MTLIDAHLLLEAGSDPVRGRLVDAAGAELRFEGWMELSAAIEQLRDGSMSLTPADPSVPVPIVTDISPPSGVMGSITSPIPPG